MAFVFGIIINYYDSELVQEETKVSCTATGIEMGFIISGIEDESYNQSFVGADEITDLRPVIMLPDNLVDCHRLIKHLSQESIRLEKEKNRMMKTINNMKLENRAIFTELIEENDSISKSEKKRLREKLRNIKKRIVGTPRKNKKRKFKDHP